MLRCVIICALLVSACAKSAPAPATHEAEWFSDGAQTAGLRFNHFNGMSGHHYYPEIMAPGVALLDYDNDGNLDAYVTQGQPHGNDPKMLADAKARGPLKDRLFHNEGHLHFTDVTEQSGINLQTYGMGVAVGHFNNDGFVDIHRTSLNGAVLLKNNGDGTFTDVTKESGAGDAGGWGVSAVFVDYDRDGWLDLFVGNYLRYSLEGDVQCESVTGRRDYCPPGSYRAQPSRLYHNRGNGTFEDVTAKALVGGAYGPALGVSAADFNKDGWLDLYVANDSQPNQLWINPEIYNPALTNAANVLASTAYQPTSSCHVAENWLTQFRGLASYQIPKVDVLFSAIVQSKPNASTGPTDTTVATNGTSLAANVTNATGTTTYNVIQPGTFYGPRVNTVDLRAAKVLTFGRTKATAGVDLYNLFNANTGLTFNQNYGTGSNYLAPMTILTPRFVRLNVTVDF
jgi:hypothetical protein